jgi:IS605 OrfB family transposase
MKLIAQIKLLPTPEQVSALTHVLERANAACNDISCLAWKQQTFGKYHLQAVAYTRVRAEYGLAAQVVIRCLAKVADAYTLDRKTKRFFRPHGSIAFDDRILSFQIPEQTISIWTPEGRQRMAFVAGERQQQLLKARQGESDLVFRRGTFYLLVTCNAAEPTPDKVDGALGVDLGIVNLATDSDEHVYSGEKVEHRRKWYAGRRAGLQSVATKPAKRRLRKLSGKQRRFQTDTNHCISKSLVAHAKSTGRGIVLEDLKGMRERVKVRHAQRARHHNWAFRQLRVFISYKALLAGTPCTTVDPRNTSQTCNVCRCCDTANRKTQALFCCVACGHTSPADVNAAKNIRDWAAVMPPMVSNLWVQGQAAGL